MASPRRAPTTALALALGLTGAGLVPAAVAQQAPRQVPGEDRGYLPADKQGFGTSRTARSNVWFTLTHGGTSEIFFPDLSTPASRLLDVAVTDGSTFVERLSEVQTRTVPLEAKVPAYRQVSRGTGWRATATYLTDPARATVLVRFRLQSRAGTPLQAFALHEPTLGADGSDDRSRTRGHTVVASDGDAASVMRSRPAFTATSSGHLGSTDGWTDLAGDMTMDLRRRSTSPGHQGQVGRLPVDGLGRQRATVHLAYATGPARAREVARRSAAEGFWQVARSYSLGWRRYVDSLRTPGSLETPHQRRVYWASLLVLAVSEDKQNRGAFIASPSEPWAWRNSEVLAPEPGPYHLVWPRDLYQHSTALLAAGDSRAADRAWEYLRRVQREDGHWSKNTKVSGEEFWTEIQLDETALPLVLAWQLQRTDRASMRAVRRAARFLITYEDQGFSSPWSEQERWENQSGYSPGTIATTIAALVCAADLMRQTGDHATARRYVRVADRWAARVDDWTVTTTGPLSDRPYYLRVSKEGDPDAATTYDPGDSYPTEVDQRTQVDPSFLELVRLGVKHPQDPTIRNTLRVVDEAVAERTPAGTFFHRYPADGYGEKADGSQWDISGERTYGRLWPIFSGERGEYELLAGEPAKAAERLAAMARTANEGLMLPEQVWDNRPPSDDGDPRPGSPTLSATPLGWTHAQYVRLAHSLDAGRPVERPSVVADRYAAR